MWCTFGMYRAVLPTLARVLRETGVTSIVDLCAGGGGPLPKLLKELQRSGLDVEGTFTDLFPNVESWQRLVEQADAAGGPRLAYEADPVDATDIPARLGGMRTMFGCFHHFDRPLATRMLQDAVDKRVPIGVFEPTNRSVTAIVCWSMMSFFSIAGFVFFRPFSLLYFIFAPLLTMMALFDGFVSCLRTYTIDELNEMTASLDGADSFEWRCGHSYLWYWPVPLTYLVGVPKDSTPATAPEEK